MYLGILLRKRQRMQPIKITLAPGQKKIVPMNINSQSYSVVIDVVPLAGGSINLQQTADPIYNYPNPITNPNISWFPAAPQETNPSTPGPDVTAIVTKVQLGFSFPSTAYLVANNGTANADVTITQQGLK